METVWKLPELRSGLRLLDTCFGICAYWRKTVLAHQDSAALPLYGGMDFLSSSRDFTSMFQEARRVSTNCLGQQLSRNILLVNCHKSELCNIAPV